MLSEIIWLILIFFICLFFYVNRNSKKKKAYFSAVLQEMHQSGITSEALFEVMTPTESGRQVLGSFKANKTPEEAVQDLVKCYQQKKAEHATKHQ